MAPKRTWRPQRSAQLHQSGLLRRCFSRGYVAGTVTFGVRQVRAALPANQLRLPSATLRAASSSR